MKQQGLALVAKRLVDRTAAAVGLVATAPIMAAVAVAVKASMGSPVLFRQKRPGFHGEPFYVYKFRTMKDTKDKWGNLLPDEARITSVGNFLRATSLDELPQLLNVLKGELSLVGPRPLLMEYLERYSPEQARRHDVMPGITGWAQIHGRNALSWEEKFALDVWYVDNWTPLLDIKILLMTVGKVINRDGISNAGHVTMPVFMGSPTPSNSQA